MAVVTHRKPVRFGVRVGKTGPASALWRLWISREGDIYVSIRRLGGDAKISLHASGDWRYGFTAESGTTVAERSLAEDIVSSTEPAGGRLIRRWAKPPPDRHGYMVAVRFIVPSMSCSLGSEKETGPKRATYVEVMPAAFAQTTFSLVIAATDARNGFPTPEGAVEAVLVARADLATNETAWLVAHASELRSEPLEPFLSSVPELLLRSENRITISADPTQRLVGFGYTEDDNQTPFMIDLDILAALALARAGQGKKFNLQQAAVSEAFRRVVDARAAADDFYGLWWPSVIMRDPLGP